MQRQDPDITITKDLKRKIKAFDAIEKDISQNANNRRYDELISSLGDKDLFTLAVFYMQAHVKEKRSDNLIRQRYMTNMLYREMAKRTGYDPLNIDKPVPDEMQILNRYVMANSSNPQAAVTCIVFTREELVRKVLKKMLVHSSTNISKEIRLAFPALADSALHSTVDQMKVLQQAKDRTGNDMLLAMISDGVYKDLAKAPEIQYAILKDLAPDFAASIEDKALAQQSGMQAKAQLSTLSGRRLSSKLFQHAESERDKEKAAKRRERLSSVGKGSLFEKPKGDKSTDSSKSESDTPDSSPYNYRKGTPGSNEDN